MYVFRLRLKNKGGTRVFGKFRENNAITYARRNDRSYYAMTLLAGAFC